MRLAAAVGVAAVLAALVAIYLSSASSGPQPERVSTYDLIDGASYDKMTEAGIFITDDSPPYQPPVSLAEAAQYLEAEADVRSLRGALIMVNSSPAGSSGAGFLPDTVLESLAWAIEVDTRDSTQPELFDPDHHTIAFVDADGGGLLGVLTQ